MTSHLRPWLARDIRQAVVHHFVLTRYGGPVQPKERVHRMIEEVFEIAQIEGIEFSKVEAIWNNVHKHPPGEPEQEIGGVLFTVLAYAQSKRLSAEMCEWRTIRDMLLKPIEHFREKHRRKIAAGVSASGTLLPLETPLEILPPPDILS